MSPVFGEFRQTAYVTRDIRATIRHFVDVAVIGPWFLAENMRLTNVRSRGVPTEINMHVALANAGAMQIEIIQPLGKPSTMYDDWLERHPTGLLVQHHAVWPVDYEQVCRDATARGWEMILDGEIEIGAFAYFRHPAQPEVTIEVSHLTERRRQVFAAIAEAAQGWDGTDPLRMRAPPKDG